MNPRWGERPADVLRLARQLASAPVDPRAGAAQTTTAAAPSLRLRVLTAQARTWQRRRERTRAILARVGAAVRILLLAIGQRLHDRKLLGAPDDIFYLLRSEIESLLGGSSLETAQRELIVARVEQRRVQHRWMLAAAPPTRLLAELPGGRLVPFEREPKSGGALLGCGASPGRVTARARVVSNFAEARTLEPGEILVTRTTDIGWTPLFRLVSAVVTEIGAPTSHAAIVARELGVPAVVNVDRVTERVRTGDMLFVDGWAGVVRQLESCAESARRDGPGAE